MTKYKKLLLLLGEVVLTMLFVWLFQKVAYRWANRHAHKTREREPVIEI